MDFLNKINYIFPNNHIKILKYTNPNQELIYQCLSCGEIYSLRNAKSIFSRISLCRKCYLPFTQWNQSEVEKRLALLFPTSDLSLLEFKTIRKGGKVKCNKCGEIENINNFEALFTGRQEAFCNNCEKNSNKIKQHILLKLKEKQLTLVEWHGVNQKMIIQCSKCGAIFSANPTSKFVGICKNCQKAWNHWDISTAAKKLKEQFGTEYKLLSFTGTGNKALFQHSCGFIFTKRYNDFFKSKGCPKCYANISQGEKVIYNYLQKHKYNFVFQQRFSDLKRFSFDFGVYLNSILILIEFNGRQHYEETNFFSDDLLVIQQRDKIKQNYCESKNIPLIIIPYWEINNIETILQKRFNDYLEKE